MQLVIAEKPSVARDLARVLGGRGGSGRNARNAIEGEGRMFTWCIGHLVELEEPATYDPRWKSWRLDTLPMIPTSFKLRAVAGTRDQLRVVRELLRDRRFTEVVNACDAGREGELIFRYVYELAGSRLPVRRLWISSLTDEAIRRGFAGLRAGVEYDALADAARCRSEADWLVGMNATRAVTLRFRESDAPVVDLATRSGGRGRWSALPPVYSIGRVQTPTLAIIVRREQAIRAFVPRDYWEVRGTFDAMDAQAMRNGAQPAVSPPSSAERPEAARTFNALWTLRPDGDRVALTRFDTRALASEIVRRSSACAAVSDPVGVIVESLVQKRSTEPPPLLFDLTSLQRTANRRHGLSASRTLEAAQALYERHKVLTYPRTDSRHLPQDLVGELPRLFRGLARIADYTPFAEPLIAAGDSPKAQSRRIFDAAKVHDHHAIIPTGKVPDRGALSTDEERIFDLVARRFLGAFHADAEFALTEAILRAGPAGGGERSRPDRAALDTGDPESEQALVTDLPPPPDRFVARGRVRLAAGWQAVAGIDGRRGGLRDGKASDGKASDGQANDGHARGSTDPEATLPPLARGQRLTATFETVARQTRPPPRHTEATLLGAMELAGREIDDETLRAAMRDTGLGTPATRAATIETLLKRGFILREGKQLVASPSGIGLIERLPVPTLASPELTGAWEARLVRMARGQETRVDFMADIVRFVRDVTNTIRGMVPGGAGPNSAVAAAARAAAPRVAARSASRGHAAITRAARARPVIAATGGQASAAVPAATTTPPVVADVAPTLKCPRCQEGFVVTGSRGWGCSRWRAGCQFVIWFTTAGKRITEAQLRALVVDGRTRQGKWKKEGGEAVAGRLVLDLTAAREPGAARFLPSDEHRP